MKKNISVAKSNHGIELPVIGSTFPGVPFDGPELELPLDPCTIDDPGVEVVGGVGGSGFSGLLQSHCTATKLLLIFSLLIKTVFTTSPVTIALSPRFPRVLFPPVFKLFSTLFVIEAKFVFVTTTLMLFVKTTLFSDPSPFPEIERKLLSSPVAPKYALLLIFLLLILVVE